MPLLALGSYATQAAVSSRSKRRLFDHLVGAGEEAVRDDQFYALAVLRLTANSNLVGCTTGKSAGFSPFRIRPT